MIRNAVPADHAALLDLWQKNATGQGYAPRPDAEVDRLLFSHPYFSYKHTFIREEQGRAVAFTCGCVGDDIPRGKERGYFTCLVAEPQWDTPETTAQLLNALENSFRAAGRTASAVTFFNPMHLPWVLPALDAARAAGFALPVVYNTGGYETLETVKALAGYVDIWLADVKYASPDLAAELSAARDYPAVAEAALRQMLRQTGAPVYDADGYLQKGVIVRHLALPGHTDDSFAVLALLTRIRDEEGVPFIPSLMSQFTPFYKAAEHNLGRRITTYEYRKVIDEAVRLGLTDGYMQEKSSAREEYTPPFDLEGV